jgi:O-acetylhomoserine/O-acetylserine sulfhydrylase-like pyridoxal-dependent enzyme
LPKLILTWSCATRKGEIYTVRYDAVNAMLLNEFLKQHRKVEEQDHRAQEQEAKIAQQQKEIQALTAAVKEQAAQIQMVSAQLKLERPGRQVADANQ